MLELYHSGLTTCSKQVRLALVEKGLSYVSRYVELFNHEQLSGAYLKINPWGVVPTLVHDGHVIVNSAAINEYLEDVFPDRPLRPADARARARMRLWTWAADMVHPALQNATYNAMMKARVAGLTSDQIDTLIARMPQPERRERLRKLVAGGFAPAEVEQAFERLDFVIGRAEADLADGPWLAGATYSLGDISMLAIVDRIGELRPAMLDRGRLPRVHDWWQRMLARPAVKQVYAAGSAETPPRPERQTVAGLA
jgi:glutathione S-transferase